MLSLTDLRKLDRKNLMKELEGARRDWLASKLALKMNQGKKSDTFQKNKRYIAQILTVTKELEKEESQKKTEEPKEKASK